VLLEKVHKVDMVSLAVGFSATFGAIVSFGSFGMPFHANQSFRLELFHLVTETTPPGKYLQYTLLLETLVNGFLSRSNSPNLHCAHIAAISWGVSARVWCRVIVLCSSVINSNWKVFLAN
jgi:hypothetical protein